MSKKNNINSTANEGQSLVHRLRSYRLIRNLLIGFILVSIINLIFSSLFFTPKMYRLAEENRELKLKYDVLKKKPKWIKQCHKLGLTVNVWTVNDEEKLRDVIAMGVDYITTDDPELAKKLIQEAANQ